MSTVADLPEGWVRLHDQTRKRAVVGGGLEAEAAWVGPWATADAFLLAVAGLEEEIEYPGGVTVTRVVPLRFPSDSPEFADVFALDVDIRGVGRSSSHPTEGITYTKGIARVLFRSQPWLNFGSDTPMMSRTGTTGVDIITRPGTAYKLESYTPAKKLNQDVGVPVPWRDEQVTLYGLQSIPRDEYDPLVGKVNSVDFLGFGPKYAQFLGYSDAETRTVGNISTYTITLRIKFRYLVKHTEIMRPDGTGFEAPVDDGGNEILPAADLNALLTAGGTGP